MLGGQLGEIINLITPSEIQRNFGWQLQLAPLENIITHNETYFETPRLLRASGSVEAPKILDLGC